MAFVKVCKTNDVKAGCGKSIDIDGKLVAVMATLLEEALGDGLYVITDGAYQSMFLAPLRLAFSPSALSTAIPVAMLTWVVMPRLSRVLSRWPYASSS